MAKSAPPAVRKELEASLATARGAHNVKDELDALQKAVCSVACCAFFLRKLTKNPFSGNTLEGSFSAVSKPTSE